MLNYDNFIEILNKELPSSCHKLLSDMSDEARECKSRSLKSKKENNLSTSSFTDDTSTLIHVQSTCVYAKQLKEESGTVEGCQVEHSDEMVSKGFSVEETCTKLDIQRRYNYKRPTADSDLLTDNDIRKRLKTMEDELDCATESCKERKTAERTERGKTGSCQDTRRNR